MARVVILGGGFGGLAAAHELRHLLDERDEIALVARSDRFFMGFAKLWDLGGLRPLEGGTASLTKLRDHGVQFQQAEITAIDPARRGVETSSGSLGGDALLVALGVVPAPRHLELLSGDAAHNLYDAESLPAMHEALDGIESGRVVIAILGGPFQCPPAPYEAALVVDEVLRRRGVRDDVAITMVTPQPVTLPAAGPDASRYVADHLAGLDIELLAQHVVKAVDGGGRRIHFQDGSQLETSVLLGVPAAAPPPVVAQSPLAGDSGWIEPDRRTLRAGFEGVYAVGDCTAIPTATAQLPKAGVFAAAEAEVAARNIAADLGHGSGDEFDGHGYCFLELPGPRVAFVEGDFFAEPTPEVEMTEADEAQFRRKQEFERERLERWLG